MPGVAPCPAGSRDLIDDTLYFGSAKPGGEVTPADWGDFLRTSVTPRFPEGLSHWRAEGQWLGQDGQLVREGSWVLKLVHDGRDAAVAAVMAEYKARHAQEAVMRVRQPACVAF